MDPRAGGEVRVRERSCARTECSEGAQGSGRLGSVESRLSRGMGLAFGERAVPVPADESHSGPRTLPRAPRDVADTCGGGGGGGERERERGARAPRLCVF